MAIILSLIAILITVAAAFASVLLSSGFASADSLASAVGAVAGVAGLAVSIYALRSERRAGEETWELSRSRDRFVLRNVSRAVLTGVRVAGDGVAETATQLPEGVTVRPGASVSFMMAGTLAHAVPDEIEVTWDGHPEPVILPVPTQQP
jgi:outer membrane murein-binding lipoprotein Lpp